MIKKVRDGKGKWEGRRKEIAEEGGVMGEKRGARERGERRGKNERGEGRREERKGQ